MQYAKILIKFLTVKIPTLVPYASTKKEEKKNNQP